MQNEYISRNTTNPDERAWLEADAQKQIAERAARDMHNNLAAGNSWLLIARFPTAEAAIHEADFIGLTGAECKVFPDFSA
ncbi:MAG: hypothetical protein LBS65_05300 [Desulfovibrio sp.]|jgi:hypothetical protein|nr:hypothetical protein [Desulfovibrio sp.]